MAIDSLRQFTDAETLGLFTDRNILREIVGANCIWERIFLETIRMVVSQVISDAVSSACARCKDQMND